DERVRSEELLQASEPESLRGSARPELDDPLAREHGEPGVARQGARARGEGLLETSALLVGDAARVSGDAETLPLDGAAGAREQQVRVACEGVECGLLRGAELHGAALAR